MCGRKRKGSDIVDSTTKVRRHIEAQVEGQLGSG
jgi:hypothetical protein